MLFKIFLCRVFIKTKMIVFAVDDESCRRKNKSLGIFCQKLIMLFMVSKVNTPFNNVKIPLSVLHLIPLFFHDVSHKSLRALFHIGHWYIQSCRGAVVRRCRHAAVPSCGGVVSQHGIHESGIVNSNPARVKITTLLTRKAFGNHLVKSTLLRKELDVLPPAVC